MTYKLDIVADESLYSKPFRDFVYYHFLTSHFREKESLDTYFYNAMPAAEKEIAKRLIRQNLENRETELFIAAGLLKDTEALPVLYQLLEKNKNSLSWMLCIGQAIWRINGDAIYEALLLRLQNDTGGHMRTAHLRQVKDLKNETSINILLSWLDDEDNFLRSMVLAELNYIITGQPTTCLTPIDEDLFYSKRLDEQFKAELVSALKRLPC